MNTEDPTSRGADLAELILDQVSSADQDWGLVAVLARELAELADRAARERPSSDPGDAL